MLLTVTVTLNFLNICFILTSVSKSFQSNSIPISLSCLTRTRCIHDLKTKLCFFLDPPGAPEVSGYIEGETIRLGQTLTLVCTAKGGNPLAEITWYRNGIKVFHYKIKIMVRNDNYFLFSLSCICVNTLFLSEKYEVTCMLNKIPLLKFSG